MIQNLDFDSLEKVFEMAYGDTIQVGDVSLKIEQTETGALITAIDKTGTTSAIVANGKNGYTPQKGVDYWTEEDKAEIETYIDEQTPDASNETPLMDGDVPSAGTEEAYARCDHRHPRDSTKVDIGDFNDLSRQLDMEYSNRLQSEADINSRIDTLNQEAERKTEIVRRMFNESPMEFVFSFVDNYKKEYRLNPDRGMFMNSISFTFANGVYTEDYVSGLSFGCGITPTEINYTNSGILNWVGTHCKVVDGQSIFTPQANYHYDIVFAYNGIQFIGYVCGFIPATVAN